MMNQESRSAKAGNETKIKATLGLAQLQLCNVAKYAFKSNIERD